MSTISADFTLGCSTDPRGLADRFGRAIAAASDRRDWDETADLLCDLGTWIADRGVRSVATDVVGDPQAPLVVRVRAAGKALVQLARD